MYLFTLCPLPLGFKIHHFFAKNLHLENLLVARQKLKRFSIIPQANKTPHSIIFFYSSRNDLALGVAHECGVLQKIHIVKALYGRMAEDQPQVRLQMWCVYDLSQSHLPLRGKVRIRY